MEVEKIPGDANLDGRVDVSDLGILAAHYGLTGGGAWELGDFNNDGQVDVSDLGILAANYGQMTAASSRFAGTGAAPDFNQDARTLGLAIEAEADIPAASALPCGSAGLPLIGCLLAVIYIYTTSLKSVSSTR